MPKKYKNIKKTKSSRKQDKVLKPLNKKYALLEGIKDILPVNQLYWQYLKDKIDELATIYGYEEMVLPILEAAALFQKTWGKNHEVLKKQMYSFKDSDNKTVALRPELMSGVIRAYFEHAMYNNPQPVKVYTYGPVFRYINPQAAMYRQHQRYDCHIVGDKEPISDAEVIILGWQFLKEMGLPTIVYINSIGCTDCKSSYKSALNSYYKTIKKRLCRPCQKYLQKGNPYTLLSCDQEQCVNLRQEAPQSVDYLCEDCKKHFMKVLEYLDQAEIPYSLNPHFIRDINLYSKTVFFLINNPEKPKKDQQNLSFEFDKYYNSIDPAVLGSGARYDGLVKKIGGEDFGGVHISFGLERVILFLREYAKLKKKDRCVDVFVAQLGDQAKKKTFPLLNKLRENGFSVQVLFNKHDLRSQLSAANKVCAKYTLIMGHKEVLDGTILLRDMESGSQEVIDYNKVIKELNKRIKKNK